MTAAIVPVMLAALQAGDTVQLVVTFESMHCAECRTELEGVTKKMPGLVSVKIAGNRVTLTLAERAPLPPLTRFPKELKVRGAVLSLRGTAVFSRNKVSFVAKGSGATLALANPTRPAVDHLGKLRAQQGGRNRFRVTGSLKGRTLVLASFQKAEWKDK